MKALFPRIEINLSKIQENTRVLSKFYAEKGISLMGVSKATLGDPQIAQAMIRGGVQFIADSRIENVQKMKAAGVRTQFVLLRTALSQAEGIISHVDISLNTELETLKELSRSAKMQNKTHKVILMIELGDLREGILPVDLSAFIKTTLTLPNIKIIGIGTNLACYGGIKPDDQNMGQLSQLANSIEDEFQIVLKIVSGGNSANYEWAQSTQKIGRINNLRVGESLLLGREPLQRKAILDLHTDACTLVAEVIEAKKKPSLPIGQNAQNAFGDTPNFIDRGIHNRAIIALGRQDVLVSGLKPDNQREILGASSDHIILDCKDHALNVGDKVDFKLDYGALLSTMTSPFVKKLFIEQQEQR